MVHLAGTERIIKRFDKIIRKYFKNEVSVIKYLTAPYRYRYTGAYAGFSEGGGGVPRGGGGGAEICQRS